MCQGVQRSRTAAVWFWHELMCTPYWRAFFSASYLRSCYVLGSREEAFVSSYQDVCFGVLCSYRCAVYCGMAASKMGSLSTEGRGWRGTEAMRGAPECGWTYSAGAGSGWLAGYHGLWLWTACVRYIPGIVRSYWPQFVLVAAYQIILLLLRHLCPSVHGAPGCGVEWCTRSLVI